MANDEEQHAAKAKELGGIELPHQVKKQCHLHQKL